MDGNIKAALDIGTYNINVVIANDAASKNIIGYGESPSIGFKKGMVSDIEACAKSIRAAVEQAEKMAGVRISSAYVGFSGSEIISTNIISTLELNQPNKEISSSDIQLIKDSCGTKVHTEEFLIIHLIPRDYAVNGCWGIDDPTGMVGSNMELEAHLVRARVAAIRNLYKALQRAEIKPMELLFTPLVIAEQLLEQAEKEIGTMVVDIGGSTTGLCWYHRGKPWLTTSLPIGSEHITSDMAIGLRAPMSVVAEIKSNFDLAEIAASAEEIEITGLSDHQLKRVSGQLVKKIIEARLSEIIDLIQTSIINYGQGVTPTELVLVGGGSKLKGLPEFFSQTIDIPVRVADINGTAAQLLINYGVQKHAKKYQKDEKLLKKFKSTFRSVINRFKN
ncbi:cell division protein FtsA [Peptococcaceae bacterium 1198_IL3148]